MRGEWNLAVEAWTTAAEMLANSPSLACRLHSEPVGFFLHRLGLLRPPDPAAVRYRLARTLLENQVRHPPDGDNQKPRAIDLGTPPPKKKTQSLTL